MTLNRLGGERRRMPYQHELVDPEKVSGFVTRNGRYLLDIVNEAGLNMFAPHETIVDEHDNPVAYRAILKEYIRGEREIWGDSEQAERN